ncbi:hypothetical protein O3M35_011822 [Rhynocoris fuscipes]|uniref:Uncharacterized protein n=1 Tax=Rhynocoris fuscipes TaxID=488301 RepID=A0AAW1CWM3_9HEMI
MGMFELSRSTSKLSGLTQSDFTTEQSSLLHLEDSLTENMIAVWKFLDKKIKPEFKHLASWVTYLGTRSINNRLHVIKKQYMWYLRLSLEARIPCLPFTGAVLQPLPDFTKYMVSIRLKLDRGESVVEGLKALIFGSVYQCSHWFDPSSVVK